MHTVGATLRRAMTQLAERSDSPEYDTRVLLAHVLDVSTSHLYSNPEDPMDARATEHFEQLMARRSAEEPLAYIIGRCGFWTLELAIDPSVLVPRPDTETLVQVALQVLPERECDVVDLGTGSGAIALALASERPDWHVAATDASEQALVCARANAQQLSLTQVEFIHGRWFEPLSGRRFNAIVSNPPYIAIGDKHLSAPELTHEPDMALIAVDNGLADLKHIARHAPDHLNPGGWLLLEHGFDQGPDVGALLQQTGFLDVSTRADLAGRGRVTMGRRV